MADVKISALPASTTPLAGTEVLPIVQSGVTKQVSVANLTAGRAVSAASLNTTGDITSSGYLRFNNYGSNVNDFALYITAAGGTTMASQSAITLRTIDVTRLSIASGGDVTVSTGNLVIGTSGKGIDFSATAGTGTSELLADYEEGTWTPAISIGGSTAGITYSTQAGKYTKIGRLVTVEAAIALTSKGVNTGAFVVAGMPFTSFGNAGGGSLGTITDITYTGVPMIRYFSGGTTFAFVSCTEAGATSSLTDANLANNSYMQFTLTYSV
jgi:hypothetical protein